MRRYLTLSIALISMCLFGAASCPPSITREEVQASIWLTNCLPEAVCTNPDFSELKKYGFYRKLNTGKLEFISFCNPLCLKMMAFYGPEFTLYLDALLPPEPKKQ